MAIPNHNRPLGKHEVGYGLAPNLRLLFSVFQPAAAARRRAGGGGGGASKKRLVMVREPNLKKKRSDRVSKTKRGRIGLGKGARLPHEVGYD